MAVDDVLLEAEEAMEKAVTFIRAEFRGIRTGRAAPALVENVKVQAYETEMTLKEVATIAAPEATMLLIKPFDPGVLKAIERAIQASDLGLTPASDGKVIRLVFPPLSGERRQRLATQVRQLGEQAKVGIRAARRDANKAVDLIQKDGEISEDEADAAKEETQELTKKYEALVDEAVQAKADEVGSM